MRVTFSTLSLSALALVLEHISKQTKSGTHPFTGYVSWMFAFLLFLTHLPISRALICLNCSEGTARVCLNHNVATMPSRHSAWVEGVRQSVSPSDRPLYPPPFPPSFPSPLKPLANYLFLFSLLLFSLFLCAPFVQFSYEVVCL